MQVKTYYPYAGMFNQRYCVLPNDGESQYEAFQSIFAEIMYASYPVPSEPQSPYEKLCSYSGIRLVGIKGTGAPRVSPGETVIFFESEETTHYKPIINGTVYDPYDYYQAKDTQGYCQMFAYFMAMNNVREFQKVDQTRKITVDAFRSLVTNTHYCLKKSIALLQSNLELYETFRYYFNHIVTYKNVEKGIRPRTTLEQYIADFLEINNSELAIAVYIHDQPLEGYEQGEVKADLWLSFSTPAMAPNFSADPPSTIAGGRRMRRRKTRKATSTRKSKKMHKSK
jgi:hypothetical protein